MALLLLSILPAIFSLLIEGGGTELLQQNNERPIIGVLSQPTSVSQRHYGSSYIAASYVKFLESAGARVVPIKYDSPQSDLLSLFSQINGLFFPGGGVDLNGSLFFKTGKYLYDLAIQANDAGDYFPIQGHCLGFELLNVITAGGDNSVLGYFDSENISLPLYYYSGYQNSRFFGNAGQDIIQILSQNVTMNNHVRGVTPDTYSSNPQLGSFYKLLSWSVDRNNKQFVSTIEAIKYPIYGLQWHAEKPAFEWDPEEVINHSTDTIKAMQYVGDFFVSEARKSKHTFKSADAEYKALIYNYSPVYSASFDSFDQMYFFT